MINDTYNSASKNYLHGLIASNILKGNVIEREGIASIMAVARPISEEGSTQSCFGKLHLIGPMRLFNSRGTECTPSGGVRKALLAILILSNDGRKGRASIQDLLWERSQPTQGAGSLRVSLSTLRKELREGLGYDPISTDNHSIKLDKNAFWVDVEYLDQVLDGDHNPIHNHYELLEGLNLRNCGGDNFEEWLRVERVHLKNEIDKYNQSSITGYQPTRYQEYKQFDKNIGCALESSSVESHVSSGIGILPVNVIQGGAFGQMLGDTVLDAMGNDIDILGQFTILDYRDCSESQKVSINSYGPIAFITLKVLIEKGRLSMRIKVNTAACNELILSDHIMLDNVEDLSIDSLSLTMFIARNVDRLLNWAAKPNINLLLPNTPYHTLFSMFQFREGGLDSLQMMLESDSSAGGSTSARALLAYLQTFRIGEHWQNYDEYEIRQYTTDLVHSVLGEAVHDPIAMTSVAHVFGYVLHDYNSGVDYLKQAVRLNPTQAFCWDHLALHQLYTGKYDEAYISANNAVKVGAYSPLRFTYDTTMCMVCTLQGKFEEAVAYGTRALHARPYFGAALRYMAVSQAHLGNFVEARNLVARIHEMDPEFSLKWISEERYALTDNTAKRLIIDGLQKAGVK